MYHFSPSLFSSTKKQKTKWKKLLITTLIYNPPSSTNNIQTLEHQQKLITHFRSTKTKPAHHLNDRAREPNSYEQDHHIPLFLGSESG